MVSVRTGYNSRGRHMATPRGNKVCQQKITLVLVAPVWKSQPWYPMLLESGTPWLTFQISSHLQPDHPDTPRECPGDDAPTSSCLAYLRRRYQHKKIRKRAQSCSSRRGDSLFIKWIIRCSGQSSDPVSGPISEVVNFLADPFKEGYQYSSLNAYRLAIYLVSARKG